MLDINILITVAFALLSCFFGYKLKKLCITLAAFAIGLFLGFQFAQMIGLSYNISLIVSAITGFFLGFVGFKFYVLGIFLLCFLCVLGFVKTHIDNTALTLIVGLIGGTIVGVLGIKFVKIVTIITTAIGGATTIVGTVLPFLNITNSTVVILVEVALAGAGIFYQYHTTKNLSESQN